MHILFGAWIRFGCRIVFCIDLFRNVVHDVYCLLIVCSSRTLLKNRLQISSFPGKIKGKNKNKKESLKRTNFITIEKHK